MKRENERSNIVCYTFIFDYCHAKLQFFFSILCCNSNNLIFAQSYMAFVEHRSKGD